MNFCKLTLIVIVLSGVLTNVSKAFDGFTAKSKFELFYNDYQKKQGDMFKKNIDLLESSLKRGSDVKNLFSQNSVRTNELDAVLKKYGTSTYNALDSVPIKLKRKNANELEFQIGEGLTCYLKWVDGRKKLIVNQTEILISKGKTILEVIHQIEEALPKTRQTKLEFLSLVAEVYAASPMSMMVMLAAMIGCASETPPDIGTCDWIQELSNDRIQGCLLYMDQFPGRDGRYRTEDRSGNIYTCDKNDTCHDMYSAGCFLERDFQKVSDGFQPDSKYPHLVSTCIPIGIGTPFKLYATNYTVRTKGPIVTAMNDPSFWENVNTSFNNCKQEKKEGVITSILKSCDFCAKVTDESFKSQWCDDSRPILSKPSTTRPI